MCVQTQTPDDQKERWLTKCGCVCVCVEAEVISLETTLEMQAIHHEAQLMHNEV